jgi:hypothetical protein
MPATPDYELIEADDCPVCGRSATLVAPVCTEGHGDQCPDRLCVECGTALFVDPLVRAARPPRRAARTA